MFSPGSFEETHPFSTLNNNKIIKFYHSSTQLNEDNKFLTKRKKNSRVLTSHSHIRSPTNLMSPLNRVSLNSIPFHGPNRPLSTIDKRSNENICSITSPNNVSRHYTSNKKLYKNQKNLKSATNQIHSLRIVKTSNTEPNFSFLDKNRDLGKKIIYDENVYDVVKQKYENNKILRENFKKQVSFNILNEKGSLDQTIQVFLGILAIFIEKYFDKFSLLPNVEAEAFCQLLDIELQSFKVFSQIHQDLKMFLQESSEKDVEFQKISKELNYLKMKNNEVLQKQIEKMSAQNYKDLNKMKLNIETFELKSNFENVRLEKELSFLQKGLEDRLDVNEINQEFKKFREITHKELLQKNSSIKAKDEIINKYIYQLNTIKIALMKTEKDLKSLEKDNLELKKNISQKENEIRKSDEICRKYKEIAQMQLADTEGNMERNIKLIKSINILNEKLSETKKKIGQNIDKIGFIIDAESVSQDNKIFDEISSVMIQKFARILSKNNLSNEDFENFVKLKTGGESQQNSVTIPKGTVQSNVSRLNEFEEILNQISLPKFQYHKPSFLNFVENSKNAFMKKNNPDNDGEKKISPSFFGTLRGILDSKYNEFLYYQDYKSYTKFPDFVYSWLSNYEINEETRTITEISVKKSAEPNEIFIDFLSNLYHPLSLKLWECQNFKEFLEEKSSNDELFFYLHCRFLLNKGPTLLREGASFSFTHYILYYYAETIVDLILKHFDEQTKMFVKARLREKAKGKNKKLFIDVSYVLKILLEYYRLERKQKFQTINDLFRIIVMNKTPNIKKIFCSDFQSFKTILERISPKITELEKAEFYRECWNLSGGEITNEILFTVLTENNYFTNNIRLNSLMNLSSSKISERLGSNFTKSLLKKDNYIQKLDFFNEKLKSHEKTIPAFQGLKKGIVELGIEKVSAVFDFDVRLFSEKYKYIDLSEFCGKMPEFVLNRVNQHFNNLRILKIFNTHFYENIDMENEWEMFRLTLEIFDYWNNGEKIKEFDKHKRVKKIQAFIKKKASKWYVLMQNLLHKIRS